MDTSVRRWVVLGIVGLIAGLTLGVVIGWWVLPVEYTNTPPSVLRQDYRDNYIMMVATVYAVEGDLDRARERLAALDAEDPAAPVIELGERLISAGGEPDEITRLAQLAWALDVITPPLAPYLEAQP
jgi:hypothetical protein